MKYLIGLLFFLAPALAFAELVSPAGSNAWEFYAFGNGEVLWEMLNSVQSMVNSEGYRNLATLLAIAGIAVVAVAAGFDPGKAAQKFMGYVVLAFIAMYLLFKMTANVIVIDPITGYSNVATGIPAVVAVPASAISEMGYWLTEKIEQNFSLPDSLTVAKGGGFMLGASLLNDAMKVKINDPYLRQSMAVYVSDCVIPDIANGNILTGDVIRATNLWNVLKVQNNSLLTVFYSADSPAGALVGCASVWSLIDSTLNGVSNDMLTEGMGAWSGTPAGMAANLSDSSAFLSGNNIPLSGSAIIKQTAVANMFNESFKTAAARTGNSEMMIAMQMAQAEQSQKSSWFTASELFKNMMGYIYSVLQAFIFALTPIIMILLFIPGFGKSVLKNYGQIMVWLVLWAPMMAIISYIVSAYGKQGMSAMAAQTQGYTLQTIPVVSEMTNNMILAGGFLMTMVPMISWGLVKGAMAFTEFISAGIGSSFASGAASGAATDALSLNNQSMNNVSMNKFDVQSKFNTGRSGVATKLNAGTAQVGKETLAESNASTRRGKDLMGTHKVEGGGSISQDAVEASSVSAQANQQLNSNFSQQSSNLVSNVEGAISTATAGSNRGLSEQKAEQVASAVRDIVTDMASVAKIGSKQEDFKLSGEMGASLRGLGGALQKDKGALNKFTEMMKGNAAGNAIMSAMGLAKAGVSASGSKVDSHTTQGTDQNSTQNTRDTGTTWTNAKADTFNQTLARADSKINALNKTLNGQDSTTIGQQSALQKAAADTISYSRKATITSMESSGHQIEVPLTDEQSAAATAAARNKPLPTPGVQDAAASAVQAQKQNVASQGDEVKAAAAQQISKDEQNVLGALQSLNNDRLNKNAEVGAALGRMEASMKAGNAGSNANNGIASIAAAVRKEGGKTDKEAMQRIGDAISKTDLGQKLAGAGIAGIAAAEFLMNQMGGKPTPTTPTTSAPGSGGKPAALPSPDKDSITMRKDGKGNWVQDDAPSKAGNAARTAGKVLRGAGVVGAVVGGVDGAVGTAGALNQGAPVNEALAKGFPALGAAGQWLGNTAGQLVDRLNGREPLEISGFTDMYNENQKPYVARSAASAAPAATPSGPGASPGPVAGAAAPAGAGASTPSDAVRGGTSAINTNVGVSPSVANANFRADTADQGAYGLSAGGAGQAWQTAFGDAPTPSAQQTNTVPSGTEAAPPLTAEQAQLDKIQAAMGAAGGISINGISNGELTVTHTAGGSLSNDERNQLVSAAQAAGVSINSIREEGVSNTSPMINSGSTGLDIFSGDGGGSAPPVTRQSLLRSTRQQESESGPEHISQYPSSR
jgi:hypothetical protein